MGTREKPYHEAGRVQNGRVISAFIDAGNVAAPIQIKARNTYVGRALVGVFQGMWPAGITRILSLNAQGLLFIWA